MSYTSEIVEKCESPIEVEMLRALVHAPWPSTGHLEDQETITGLVPIGKLANSVFADVLYSLDAKAKALEPRIKIIPQACIKNYRADFVVEATLNIFNENTVKVVVECDGREFHSDYEDVRRDKRRELELIKAGYWVIRFTGSEIYRSAKTCALRVIDCIMSLHQADRKFG